MYSSILEVYYNDKKYDLWGYFYGFSCSNGGWWEGFTEAEYKKYWVIRFGISTNDDVLFGQYVKLRWKYYNDPDQKPKDPLKNRNWPFSTIGSVTSDPLAESFYSSNSLDESYIKLKGLVSKELIYL